MTIQRRLADALRRQDWVTVLIEFAMVVLGVLLALQVNTWNEARHARSLERQYLERLFDDLNGSIEDFNTNIGWEVSRLETQYLVLESLRAGALDPGAETMFESGLAWAGIHNPQRRRWGTVEELFSTGNIALIRDVELRSEISRLGGWYDRNDAIVRDASARVIPLRAQLTRHYEIVRAESTTHGGQAEVNYDFETLASDPAFLNTFSDLHVQSELIYGFSYGSMEEFADLRDRLAGELGIPTEGLPQLPDHPERPWRNFDEDGQ
ncbi:hypothetical protein V0U79_00035 [Hyphobacterium sp. HN65]|uniref:Uncharacterized protein n=1 Tax=Hyphobacterium lacteum TaxID=3116575 RepID=A0ABU7LLD6_9PROT|nr:hypothetical protein [Hyphobacterium sp. HN65]MEE2524738.1 hypothetical protein [Hyphobacterium sp. HN65]